MTAKFIQTGDAVDYTPDADVKAGDVVVQGELVGVAKLDIPAGKLGALALTGVFDFPKATGVGTAIAVGTRLYWDHDENVVRTDSDSGEYQALGLTVKAAADTDGTVRVRLSHFEAHRYEFPT